MDAAADTAGATGRIVAIQGSVVDVAFNGPVPPIDRMLLTGPDRRVVVEVAALVGPGMVRGLALNPAGTLALDMEVVDTGDRKSVV